MEEKERKGARSASLLDSKRNPVLLAVLLSIPAILEQLLITATSYVDTAMVGSLGAGATAAISVTSSCNWLINGVLTALGVGYSVKVAFYIGAGEKEHVRNMLVQATLGCGTFGLLFLALGVPLSFVLPAWMGAAAEIRADAAGYMLVMMLILPSRTYGMAFSAILRCMGNTKIPMLFNTLTNVLNIFLNLLFIFPAHTYRLLGMSISLPGAGLGVVGAGIATGISVTIGAVCMTLAVLRQRGEYRPRWRGHLRVDLTLQRAAIAVAIPVALERITISTGQIIMTRMVSSLGTVALAANYIAVTAEQICYMPAYGIASASTALVGQACGAGQWEQAKKFGKITGWIGTGLSGCMAVIMFLAAGVLSAAFSSDGAVVVLSAQMLRIVSVAEPMFGMSTVMSGALRGVGEAKYPFFVGVICMLGVRVSLASVMVFGFHLGLEAVWIAMAVDLNLRGVLNYRRFMRGRWSLQNVAEEHQEVHA